MYTYYWKKLIELKEEEDVMGYISLGSHGRKGLVSLRIKQICTDVDRFGYTTTARRQSHLILPKQVDDNMDKKGKYIQYTDDDENVHIKDIVEMSAWLKSLAEVYL